MKTFVIAEAGINHNGSFNLAKKMIDLSKLSKASAVKFQIYDTDRLFSKDFKYYNDSKRGMLSYRQHRDLADYAKEIGIEWLASPFHLDAIDLMEKAGVKKYKVASRSVFDLPLLELIAQTEKPVIMSCGMGREKDIDKAVDVFYKSGSRLTLLYCVCNYPTKEEDIDFKNMIRLGKDYGVPFGFSSHCPNIEKTMEAIKLGATVIEHHVTTDRNLEGCDQSSSLEFPELQYLIKEIVAYESDWKRMFR